MELICPKCQGAMRTYERSGITVDQCSECRGIFLDRGELERLVDAETAFHATPGSAPSVAAPAYGSPGGDRYRDERPREDRYRDERHRDERYRDDRDKDARYRDDRYKDDKYKDDRYKDDRYKEGHYDPRKQKKRSFLDDLFG
jgi:Zn-finger nucleic acid-binding protein